MRALTGSKPFPGGHSFPAPRLGLAHGLLLLCTTFRAHHIPPGHGCRKTEGLCSDPHAHLCGSRTQENILYLPHSSQGCRWSRGALVGRGFNILTSLHIVPHPSVPSALPHSPSPFQMLSIQGTAFSLLFWPRCHCAMLNLHPALKHPSQTVQVMPVMLSLEHEPQTQSPRLEEWRKKGRKKKKTKTFS